MRCSCFVAMLAVFLVASCSDSGTLDVGGEGDVGGNNGNNGTSDTGNNGTPDVGNNGTEDTGGNNGTQDAGNNGTQDVGEDVAEDVQEDLGTPDVAPDTTADVPNNNNQLSGTLSEDLCGSFLVVDDITVPSGTTINVCAGSSLTVSSSRAIRVQGELILDGTMAEPIIVTADPGSVWSGFVVGGGSLTLRHTRVEEATVGINGQALSNIAVEDSVIDCRTPMELDNGGRFDRTTITGMGSIWTNGGMLQMTDTSVELSAFNGPDCLKFRGQTGAVLDHISVRNCHCPIHIEAAPLGFTMTNSIMEQDVFPVMIRDATATFTGNHFIKGNNHILDIGGNFSANVAGNYWEGGAPDISTTDIGQFTGVDDYSTTPFPNVGPR